jgi:hypothetical protein
MPIELSEQGPFSVDKFTLTTTTAADVVADRTFTLDKADFIPTLPETLEVLIDGVKLKGDGTAIAAGSGDEFYVNSATDPTTMTIETNAVLLAQSTSTVTTLASGNKLVIRRLSNRGTKNVDYAPGSVIREVDLDNSNIQILHVAQEAVDIAISGIVLAANDKFDGKSKVIENVDDGVAANDAVNFGQLTATEVATLAYKEDTEDYKLETADWATKVNAVVNTYTDNVAQTDGSEYSAKEYAQGSTLAVGGSSKNWAQLATTPTTTATDASAKEWAIGVSTHKNEGSAKDWATYTAGDVRGATGGSMSSKEWAVGSQGRGTVNEGSAKEWATLPVSTGTVDNTSYSSKEYSQSTTAGTSTYGGSAKGWAQTALDTAVPGAGASDRSSLHYSTLSANSATAAKASAAAVASTFDSFDDTYLGTMADGATATDADTTGTWAINSNVITVASGTNIVVGQEVTGTGIPTDANVIVVAGTSITISENMTAAGSGVDLDFRGQGVYGAFNVTKDGPATDNDGGALANGMLYFNTTDNSMKVYKETGAAWIKTSASGGVSLVMHKYTASGSESAPVAVAAASFTPTLSYEVNNLIVWLNGVKLDATDYAATTGTTITGLAALAASDELVVLAFKTFEVGDAVSAASGGTFAGAVTFSAGLVANTVDINGGTFDGIVGGTTPAVGSFTTIGASGAITANGGLETDTNSKIKQKGAFMQNSVHQSWVMGG